MARASLTYLAISLSKRETQGELLTAHIELINGWHSLSCVVSLGDTLHRHNLLERCGDPARAHLAARALGDEWTAQEGRRLQGLKVPWRLMRHDEMLALEAFPTVRDQLAVATVTHRDLAAALAADVEAFAIRAGRELDEQVRAASAAYILEELAADIAFARIQPFSYVYPGRPLNIYLAVQRAAERLPLVLRGLEECTFVRTRVRKGRVRAA
jgi:hypothetical protein